MSAGSGEGPYLSDISFEIEPGEQVAVIGPGDAGKTLLLRLILGLATPESGTITVFGEEPGSVTVLQRIGAVLEAMDFPPLLRVNEIIDLVRAHFTEPAAVQQLVQQFGMFDLLDERAGDLNIPTQRWLAVFLSMIGKPEGLVLDSPAAGMDVGWRHQLWELLGSFTAGGGAAIFTTDVLHDLEHCSTRVMLVHRGEILADGSCSELLERHGTRPAIVSPLEDAGLDIPPSSPAAMQAALEREQRVTEQLEDIILRLTGEVRR